MFAPSHILLAHLFGSRSPASRYILIAPWCSCTVYLTFCSRVQSKSFSRTCANQKWYGVNSPWGNPWPEDRSWGSIQPSPILWRAFLRCSLQSSQRIFVECGPQLPHQPPNTPLDWHAVYFNLINLPSLVPWNLFSTKLHACKPFSQTLPSGENLS